jgi:N utilization substance protein A
MVVQARVLVGWITEDDLAVEAEGEEPVEAEAEQEA